MPSRSWDGAQGDGRCYVWDRKTRKATLVLDDLEHLKGYQIAKVQPLTLAARGRSQPLEGDKQPGSTGRMAPSPK